MIAPRPPLPDQMAGSANLASPAAGVAAKVLVRVGQQVHANDPVIQLDDRLAKAAEDQAVAALNQAQASLATLKATPRPDQLEIAQLGVNKAQSALEFAQSSSNRVKELAAEQGERQKCPASNGGTCLGKDRSRHCAETTRAAQIIAHGQ